MVILPEVLSRRITGMPKDILVVWDEILYYNQNDARYKSVNPIKIKQLPIKTQLLADPVDA